MIKKILNIFNQPQQQAYLEKPQTFSLERELAIFIDCENVNIGSFDKIQELLKDKTVSVKRAYAKWDNNPNVNPWKKILNENNFTLVTTIGLNPGKNSSDIKMTIDVVNFLNQRNNLDYILVTSDSDFAALAIEIKEKGNKVIGVGNENAKKAYANICNSYIHVPREDNFKNIKVIKDVKNINEANLQIKQLIKKNAGTDFIEVSKLGMEITFNPKEFGFKNLTKFIIEHKDLYEYEVKDTQMYVKEKN